MVYPVTLHLSFEQNCKPFESYLKAIFNFLTSFAETKMNMKTPNSKFDYISILYFDTNFHNDYSTTNLYSIKHRS